MIQFRQVSKAFGTQDVLNDVSFVVRHGERVGIVGPNGAGKSTIFDLITGKIGADAGEVGIPGSMTIGYVRQQLDAHRTASDLLEYASSAVPRVHELQASIHRVEAELATAVAAERESKLREIGELQTAFEQLGGYTVRHRAEAMLSGLGFSVADFVRPFSSFSGGWQMRAELARTLVAAPDVLLLDEPTNYLDVPAVEWLRDFLRSFGGTLVLVSHDRYLLNSLTTKTLEVAGTQVTTYAGNYSWYVREREQRLSQILAARKNQDRRREQIEGFVERFRAKNTKASQVQSRIKMLEKMEPVRVSLPSSKPTRIRLPDAPASAREVLRLEDAGVTYDGERWVLRHLDLRVERGDRIGMVGLNGMGKTTLLRVLAGKLELSEGKRVVGSRVRIGYQSQDFTDVLSPDQTVFETVRARAAEMTDGEVRSLLGGFRFSGAAVDKQVQVLSGGEKVRLGLARLLATACNLLILDEPTTHLDVQAREALEEALQDYRGTLCIVSHDIEFLRHAATAILFLSTDGIRRYYGDYGYFCEKRREESASAALADDLSGAGGLRVERKEQKREDARRRQELYRLRRPVEARVSAAERKSGELEREQQQLVQSLEAGDERLDFEDVNRRLAEIRDELAAATEAWENASLELDELLEEYSP